MPQGSSLVFFVPAESSFSHLLSHCAAFPGKDAFLCSLEMSDVMALEWRHQRTEPVGFCQPQGPPALSPFSGLGPGRVSEAESWFLLWTMLIEPCQEKIMSWKGSRLFAGEQKKWGWGEQV